MLISGERDEMISIAQQRVAWCYSKHQPELLKQLLSIYPTIEYVEVIPTNVDSMFARNQADLLLLDDLMDAANVDKRIPQLVTRRQHDKFSVIYLT